MLNDDS